MVEIPPENAADTLHLKGWLVTSKTAPHHGAVVILHGCNGLNERGGWGHALQWAYWLNRQRLAAIGFSHGGWVVVEAAFGPAGAKY